MLWERQLRKKNSFDFPTLTELLNKATECDLDAYVLRISNLKAEFESRFSDFLQNEILMRVGSSLGIIIRITMIS